MIEKTRPNRLQPRPSAGRRKDTPSAHPLIVAKANQWLTFKPRPGYSIDA